MADDLARAQSSLERALARARAGEDRVLMAQVRERGEQFINLLNGVIRMGHIHSGDNHAFDQPVQDLKKSLDALAALLGRVHLVTVEDQVYLNDVRMKPPAGTGPGKHLGAELNKHNIGGLSFGGELSADELRTVVSLLGGRPAPQLPRTAVARALLEKGITRVELAGIFRFRLSADEGVARDVHSLVRRIVTQVDETWDNVATGKQVNVLALRRLVVELQQFGPHHEHLWVVAQGQHSAHGWHALRVAQHTMMVAQALGFAAGLQQDYGVAALTHDVGYAVPLPQAHSLRGHGVAGVRGLLRQVGFHEAKLRRICAALHHHDDLTAGQKLPLVARLVRVAEDYETFQRAGLTPPEALSRLAGGAGQAYDPVLVQVLINRLGLYPPGTHLALEDGRVVRSVSVARTPQSFATPLAMVELAGGQRVAPGTYLDLATEGRVRGSLRPHSR
jgi:hypothetical protein